ncbi:MAG: flagellin lysine-N-methylase [Clostridia bacterium]|nr:flagellin lysine-N-methylase [Clostridia bacterium]
MYNKEIVYPDYFKKFRCIGADCTDTCCKAWDIVIDEDTLAFYRSIPEIDKHIITDSDGDNIIAMTHNGCPFLDCDMLCRIQKKYGEEKLCEECRKFPRISQDFTEFEEYMLSLACPAACWLIFSEDNTFDEYYRKDVQSDDNVYPNEIMNFLIKARTISADIFGTERTFSEQMSLFADFNGYVGDLLFDECYDTDMLDKYKPNYTSNGCFMYEEIFDIYSRLDYLNSEFKELVAKAKYSRLDDTRYDKYFRRLALYYIYRYYLCAISDDDVLKTVCTVFGAYTVISGIIAYLHIEDVESEILHIISTFSKETDHSFENREMLCKTFLTHPAFEVDNMVLGTVQK